MRRIRTSCSTETAAAMAPSHASLGVVSLAWMRGDRREREFSGNQRQTGAQPSAPLLLPRVVEALDSSRSECRVSYPGLDLASPPFGGF